MRPPPVRPRRGRPPAAGVLRDVQLRVRVTPAEHAALAEFARSLGLPLADAARRALFLALRNPAIRVEILRVA